MSKNQVMEQVLAIHDLLISHGSRRGRSPDIDRLNQLMSEIKSVGRIEKMAINGGQGTYLVMDGQSWQDACRDLGISTAPSFVMWEETAFFSFIHAELLAPLVSKETVQDVVFPILPVDRERVEEAHSPDGGEEFNEPLVLVEVDIPLP